MSPQTAQNHANEALQALGTYHERVPLQALIAAVEAHGWVTGDNTGMVFHKLEGRHSIPCWYRDEERERAQDALHRLMGAERNVPVTRRNLTFTWYRMESGRYEIVAYLS